MVRQREVRANLAIETHYYRKLEATKNKRPKALGCIVIIPELHHKIRAAKDRAKADGRPIDKLSLKIIQDVIHDRI